MNAICLYLLGFLVAMISTDAAAQCPAPGCLEAGFGSNGTGEVVSIMGNSSYARRIAIENVTVDRTTTTYLVAAVELYLSSGTYLGVARYTLAGALDTSFGSGGVVNTNVAGYVQGLAVQPDGKILVAGFGGLLLVRLNTDGTLDSSFGSHGVVSITAKRNPPSAWAVAVQRDGRIVVAGDNGGMTAWRFTSTGALDTSFGSGGSATVYFGRNVASRALTVGLQTVSLSSGETEQRVLLGGWDSPGGTASGDNFAIARLTAAGLLDTTFGAGGIVTKDFFGQTDVVRALAIDGANNIVAAGTVQTSTGHVFALVRYSASGALDSGFGSNGTTLTQAGSSDSYLYDAMIGSDGKIVAGGTASSSSSLLALARYTPAGLLDTTFGAAGIVTQNFAQLGATGGSANSVMQEPNGLIVAAGQASVSGDQTALAGFDY